MKAIFLALFCSFYLLIRCAAGQVPPPHSNAQALNQSLWATLDKKYENPIIILDDKFIPDSLRKRTLDSLDRHDILKITVLHYSSTNKRNVAYLTTKDPRIAAYQGKLAALSPTYKSYLKTHHNKDGLFIYIVNRVPLQGTREERIGALYKMLSEKIIAISVSSTQTVNGIIPIVEINTKH